MLALHSWLRWLVLAAALFAIVRAVRGAAGRRPWAPLDQRAGGWYVMLLDVQLLLGLLLYFVWSPITAAALEDFGAAMGNSRLRFWAVEHLFGMLVGLALAHAGRLRSKRLADAAARHKVAAISYILSLLAILISIPWPGTPNGRPLFPM